MLFQQGQGNRASLGGRLYERVVHRSKALEVEEVIQIYYQICQAVKHMHEQDPPIIHRDLKVENCLLTSTGFIQLCDFGSATSKVYLPDETWTVKKRDYVEDEMTKVTTPMYRAPEMLDTYSNHPINEQVDIWVEIVHPNQRRELVPFSRLSVVFCIISVLSIIPSKIQQNYVFSMPSTPFQRTTRNTSCCMIS